MPNSLTRWDPMTELASMRGMMDRLFDQGFGRFPALRSFGEELNGNGGVGLDVFETNDDFVVKASVPGVEPKDVEITVEDDVLTIKGESEHREETKEGQYLRREIRTGSFSRSLRLPPTVDAEKAEAAFEHGILKLTLPKRPEARAKSFKITPSGVQDVIEGEKAASDQHAETVQH